MFKLSIQQKKVYTANFCNNLFLINNDFVLIDQIRLKFVDNLLQKNELISIIFTSFCLLILINGSNFIDGTNLQCSGYYLSILITLLFLSFENFLLQICLK